jgi:hypothetical protein
MKYLLTLALTAFALPLLAAESDGFVPMFNGRDLTGWTNINCAPETWTVKAGVIHCTGRPVGALRTLRQYENFILEAEWRHLTSGGNSGVFMWSSPISAPGVPFLRGIEVQVLDHGYAVNYEKQNGKKSDWFTTHGDVFPIHGATMKPFGRHHGSRSFPSEDRSKPSPEWNHYRIVATNGVLRLSVNGVEVSGGEECNYRKGYIGLESEGAPVEFRNLRLMELPPGGATPAATAPLDPTWQTLFTGLDLRGWNTNRAAVAANWAVQGERLRARGDAAAVLWTTRAYRDAEWTFDAAPEKPAEGVPVPQPVAWIRGADGKGTEVRLPTAVPGRHQRYSVRVLGRAVTVSLDGVPSAQWTLPEGAPKAGEFGLGATGGRVEFMNVYVRDVR